MNSGIALVVQTPPVAETSIHAALRYFHELKGEYRPCTVKISDHFTLLIQQDYNMHLQKCQLFWTSCHICSEGVSKGQHVVNNQPWEVLKKNSPSWNFYTASVLLDLNGSRFRSYSSALLLYQLWSTLPLHVFIGWPCFLNHFTPGWRIWTHTKVKAEYVLMTMCSPPLSFHKNK